MARFSRFSRKPRFSRFRRKRRGAWFPVLGTNWFYNEDEYRTTSLNLGTSRFNQERALGPVQNIWPVTKDYTQEPGLTVSTDTSLRDFVNGQHYVIDRIVGELPLQIHDDDVDETDRTAFWRHAEVAAGLFIAKVSDVDQSLPMGVDADYDPFSVDNAQNPWIWRRTWMLSNPEANVLRDDFPISNTNFSGDASGSHIDSKVKRRVGREERLFFVLAGMGWDGDRDYVSSANQPWVEGVLNIRIYGHMVSGRQPAVF